MRACRSIEFIANILPVRAWKGNILEHHVNRCASCRAKLDIQDKARRYVIEPGAITSSEAIWTAVEVGIQQEPRSLGRRFSRISSFWKIGACVAAAAPLVYLVILISKPHGAIGPRPKEPTIEEFRLDSAEAWGQPVSAVIYQARDSQIRIIWVK
jgi:hypothetical protein